MQKRRFSLCTLVVAGVLLLPVAAFPQASQGSVSGNVVDPSGAVVPDAELILTSLATGAEAFGVSGSQGFYSFPNLTPGKYVLQVTSPGFKIYVQSDIEVTLGSDVRIDVRLAVGAQTETVGVSPSHDTPKSASVA